MTEEQINKLNELIQNEKIAQILSAVFLLVLIIMVCFDIAITVYTYQKKKKMIEKATKGRILTEKEILTIEEAKKIIKEKF